MNKKEAKMKKEVINPSLYKAIFDKSLDGILIADVKTRKFMFANPEICKITGYTFKELLKLNIDKIHPKKDLPYVLEQFKKQIQGKITLAKDIPLLRKDKKTVYCDINSKLIKIEKQKLLLGIFREVTEQKRADGIIKKEKEKYKFIVDNSTDIILIISKVGKLIFANKSAIETIGYSEKEIIGKSVKYFLTKDSVKKALYSIAQDFLGNSKEIKVKIKTKSGEIRHLKFSKDINLVREEGKIIGILVNAKDITEQEEAENELHKSENNYHSFINATDDMVFLKDSSFRYLVVNTANQKFFGKSESEIIGKTDFDLMPKKAANNCRMSDKQALRKHCMVLTTELVGDRTYESHKFPVLLGSTYGVGCFIRDITERKKAEEALRESEANFKSLFENMSSGVAVYEAIDNGKDFIFTDFNKAGEKIDNLKKEYVMEKSILRVFPGIKKFGLFEIFQKVWKTGKTEYYPPSFYKDKRLAGWRENYVYKLPSGRIVAIYDDITERKKAEEVLKKSEERLNESQRIGRIGSWEFDVLSNKIFWSDESYELYERDKSLGPPSTKEEVKYYSPEESRRLHNMAKIAIIQGKEFKNYDTTVNLPSGKIAFFNAAMYPVKDDRGKVVKLIGIVQDITERKKAETALKESEKKFRTFIDTAADLMHITDKDGNFSDVNKSMIKVLGYSREQLLKMSIPHILTKKAFENDFKPHWKEFIANGKINIETTFITKYGKEVYGQLNAIAIYDNKGKYSGARVIFYDLTERKKAEEAIMENEKRYKSTFENTGTAIAMIEEDTTLSMVNKRFEELSGYSKKEIEGKLSWTKFVHKENIEKMKEYHNKRRKKGEKVPNQYEFRFIDKKGNIKNIFLTVNIIPGTKKSIASLMDISALKNAEEAIHNEVIHRRTLMEQSRDGIVVLNQDGSVYESNKQFAKMLGFSPEEVSHLHVWDWEFQFTREQVQGMLRDVDETGDHFETKHRRKDGTTYDVEISTNAAVFTGEKLIFCVCRDITKRKQMEQETKNRNEELERFNKLAVGRELKMIELKKRIKELEEKGKNK